MLYKAILVTAALILCSCVETSKQSHTLQLPQNPADKNPNFDTWGHGPEPWLTEWERTQKRQAQMNKEMTRGTKKKSTALPS